MPIFRPHDPTIGAITTGTYSRPGGIVERESLIGVDLAQITSAVNRSNPRPGDPQPTLAAESQPAVAFGLRANPGGVGQGHNTNYAPVVEAYVYQQQGTNVGPMGTLRRGNGNETGGVPFVAFAELSTDPSAPDQEGAAIAFGHTQGLDVQASEQATPTMRAGNGGGGAAFTASGVRRLTPVECERLQGYPDRWTAVSAGKPQADSPRYRELGNSIAVPVFEWVAGRLVEVDRSLP